MSSVLGNTLEFSEKKLGKDKTEKIFSIATLVPLFGGATAALLGALAMVTPLAPVGGWLMGGGLLSMASSMFSGTVALGVASVIDTIRERMTHKGCNNDLQMEHQAQNEPHKAKHRGFLRHSALPKGHNNLPDETTVEKYDRAICKRDEATGLPLDYKKAPSPEKSFKKKAKPQQTKDMEM